MYKLTQKASFKVSSNKCEKISDITFPLTMYARKMFQSCCFNKLLKEETTVTVRFCKNKRRLQNKGCFDRNLDHLQLQVFSLRCVIFLKHRIPQHVGKALLVNTLYSVYFDRACKETRC